MKHLLADLVSYGSLAKLFLGGALHKAGSYLYGKFKGAESKVKVLAADLKKDL